LSLRETLSDLLETATTPTAYSVYAGAGVIITTALAIFATKKFCDNYYEKVLDKKPYESEPPKPSKKEAIKTFAPVVLSGALTLFFISKANSEWIDYNGLIGNVYAMAENRAARYQSLASVAAGTELIRGLGNRKPDEGLDWYCVSAVGEIPDIYFQAKREDILEAMYHTNRNFQLRGTSSVGEFFAFLPISDEDLIAACPNWNKIKDMFGWDAYEFCEGGLVPWIDFDLWHVDATETTPWIGKILFTWPPEPSKDGDLLASGYRLYPTE
jgi:hypothetical protein